jgi:hypothetical protein
MLIEESFIDVPTKAGGDMSADLLPHLLLTIE